MKTKEELLKQLDELVELAKSKGLIKVDPVTKLPGTMVDKKEKDKSVSAEKLVGQNVKDIIKNPKHRLPGYDYSKFDKKPAGPLKKDGPSIQSGINQATAAGGVPHTTPAGSTLSAVQAMGSAFGKSGKLDKSSSKDLADRVRAVYGVNSSKEKSISANNNPDPSMEKSGSSPDQEPGNGELGMKKSSTQPINENVSSHESSMIKKEALGKPVPKGVDPKKYDDCVDDVKAKSSNKKTNAYAVCASSLKKDGSMQAGIAAAGAGANPQPSAGVSSALSSAFGKSSMNKCDKLKGIIGSLKKGFFLP